jgi:hypothetical protein
MNELGTGTTERADGAPAVVLRESYDAYCARTADELADEHGWTEDDWDEGSVVALLRPHEAPYDDPEPPTPAAPVAAVLATIPCTECRATGTVRHSTGFGLSDWIEEACGWCKGTGTRAACPSCRGVPTLSGPPCWYCQESGVDHLAGETSPATVTHDRTAHLRRIGQTGGLTTYARYGSTHMRAIGRAGYAATVAAHGQAYARDILRGKGWTPRKPDLLSDLRAGRALAALAAAA